MTRILILFGTTDGQTAKVARFLGDELDSLGADVDVVDAAVTDPDPEGYDGVLVAASIHAGGYQRAVLRWAAANAAALQAQRTAFLSVCLGVLQSEPAVRAELDAIRKRFIARTHWTPTQTKLVAGALMYSRYGWLKRLVMRRIARKAGGGTDPSRDYEYTDWADLRAFAGSFYSLCAPARAPAARCGSGSPCQCGTATIAD
jgi:menaquinone-dependent protoporphyrinogen oxidase